MREKSYWVTTIGITDGGDGTQEWPLGNEIATGKGVDPLPAKRELIAKEVGNT